MMSEKRKKNCDFFFLDRGGGKIPKFQIFFMWFFSSDDTENIESKLIRCAKRNYSAILIRNC